METGNHVLLIGFDPRTVPDVDAEMATLVEAAMAMGDVRLKEHGFDADYCLVAPDAAADRRIVEALTGAPYDCVGVGGGIRKPDAVLRWLPSHPEAPRR